MRRLWAGPWIAIAAIGAAACALEEITVIDFVDVAVAEVYVMIGEVPANNQIRAFLHGTSAGAASSSRTFDDARVSVTRDDGLVIDLLLGLPEDCLESQPEEATGTCFLGDPVLTPNLRGGDALELDIVLGNGGTLFGSTRIPGSFQIVGVGSSCLLPPDTLMPVSWSRSDDAWAYVNETSISGLTDALASDGIDVEDPLYLLGLSVSSSDTTVVFPSEFGIFDRFDLDQDLAVRLQSGLPDGTSAAVSITAVDRNYVNWARGSTFNPSGQVRVSSLRGDGSGVFGAGVIRQFVVISSANPGTAIPVCPLL